MIQSKNCQSLAATPNDLTNYIIFLKKFPASTTNTISSHSKLSSTRSSNNSQTNHAIVESYKQIATAMKTAQHKQDNKTIAVQTRRYNNQLRNA